MALVSPTKTRLETDTTTLQFYSPPPRPDLKKTKKLPVRRFKRKFTAGKGFTIGGRVLGPIWDLYVPAVKTDPSLAPKQPSECDLAVKALKKLLRDVGIPSGTPGITYNEEIRVILQKRYDVYKERVVRQKVRTPYNTAKKRIRLMQKYCAERLTLVYERALLEEDFDGALLAIELGAPANWMTRRGDTPLTIAIKSKQYTYIKPFVDVGVPVDRRDSSGWTPLCIAIQQKELQVAQLLLQLGADPMRESIADQATKESVSPLMVAVCHPSVHVDLVYLLLQNGARVNQASSIGRTALMFACRWRQIANARILLEEYANPAMIDKAGYTATEWVKYAARERMVQARQEKKTRNERLHTASTSSSDVVDKIALLFGGQVKEAPPPVLDDEHIALNILEQELVDEMEAKMKQRGQSKTKSKDRFGMVDVPAASSREGAALELLKRGYSVFDVVAKWKEAIGGESASVEDIRRVLAQRVSEQRAATKKQVVSQSAAAAFVGNAAAARERRDEARAQEDLAAIDESMKNATSDALLDRYGIDSLIPEQNEWKTDPRSGGAVRRIKPNKWLGYDLDSRSFQMKPSQSMLVLAAHPSALIRNVTKRILRIRAAEVTAQREEAAMKRFELSTGRSRNTIKTRGRTQRMSDSKAVLGRIDAQLSAQVAFGNFLSGYEGATKAMIMSDIPEAEDADEQAVLVLTQDQLCANCNKRAARLRDLNNNKRLCEKCTLWMSQQPGLQHHRFKPIPPPGMNDGIMAKRQEHKAKEAQAMKRVSGMVENSISRMRQTFQRVKRDLGSGKHLLPPLEETPDGIEEDAFKSATSTPRSVASARTALTGMDSVPASPRQNVLKRLKQLANADGHAARRQSNVGDHPLLAAATTRKTQEQFSAMEAAKAAKASAVAAAAAHLLQNDPEYPARDIMQVHESKEAKDGALDLGLISRLGRLPQRIETFEERHARVDSRPGSSRWEAGVRGLIGQAARERALRNEKKAQLFKQTQMGDFGALEKLKKLVEKTSAVSIGPPRGASREDAQRMADFAMLRQRPQTSAVDGRPEAKRQSPSKDEEHEMLRPQTSAADTTQRKASSDVQLSGAAKTIAGVFEMFEAGHDVKGSHEVEGAREAKQRADELRREREAKLRAEHEAQKRQRLLQKKRERLGRMADDLGALELDSEVTGSTADEAMGDKATQLVRLAQSLENGHGIPAQTADEKKANILRRAAVLQGQPLSPLGQKKHSAGIDSAAVVGRQRLVNDAARTLGNLGFGAPGAGAHASSYFGENLVTEFATVQGPSVQGNASALDRITSVSAARRSMGGAVRNLAVEQKIQQAAANDHQKQTRLQDDARRATAKLRVQALYTRPSEISLAYVLMEQGKLEDARRVLTDLLAKQKVTLADMHIGFIATLVALGRLYVQTGRFEGALEHLQQAQYMLDLHKVHPGNEDAFLAIYWISAAYTGLKKGTEENAAVEAYVTALKAAYDDAAQWQRRKAAGAVHASEEYENYNGQQFNEEQKAQLWERLVPVVNTSRQHRELQGMKEEDTRRQGHSEKASLRRARRRVRAQLTLNLETNWRIQQRWLYNRYFDDILFKQMPEVDPLVSEEALEPARQKDEHEALEDLEKRPTFYGAHADTDGHSDSSGDEASHPGAEGNTQMLKMTDCDNNLKAALSYSRWQQMLEKLAERDGIEYSVKFLAAVLKYNSANYNRVNIGGDFDKQRQIEIVRSNQAAKIADLYIKHPQTLSIVPMNMRERILAAQHVSPLPFDVFQDAFQLVWQQVKQSVWQPFLGHALGRRFTKERLLSLLLPTWSMSMVAKLAAGGVDAPVTAIAKIVRGVQARTKAAQLLHQRYRQLVARTDRVFAAEQFLEKWMRRLGMSTEQIEADVLDPAVGAESAAEYWEYAEAEESHIATGDEEDVAAEFASGETHGVDEHGFPWQYDPDGYVVYADKDGLQFYRDENSYCYFFDDDSQQVFFEPIPPSASELEHMFEESVHEPSNLGAGGHSDAVDHSGALSVIAEASTISEQPSMLSEGSLPHLVEQAPEPAKPKKRHAPVRPKRVFKTKAEAGRVIERIGRGFIGRLHARNQLLRVYRCEYDESTDRFEYVDTRSGAVSSSPPSFLSVDYPTVRRGEHPLTAPNTSQRKPLAADDLDQVARQAAALARKAPAATPAPKPPPAATSAGQAAYFYSVNGKDVENAYPGLQAAAESKASVTEQDRGAAQGDGETWGFDSSTQYPWMLDEYGAQRFTDGASLTFYRDEHGAPFYYDESGAASYCDEAELVVPKIEQVESFFARGDGSLQV